MQNMDGIVNTWVITLAPWRKDDDVYVAALIGKLHETVPLHHEPKGECAFLATDCKWCLTSYEEELRIFLFYS